MSIDFTDYLLLNWVILALTLGAFWTAGSWLMTTLLGSLRRKPQA
jgi:hypothetical protein